MAAALQALLTAARWRWTPFFGLLAGSLLYVLLVLLIVPSKIGPNANASSKQTLDVLTDDAPPLNAAVGRSPRASVNRPLPGAQPPMPQPQTPPPMVEQPAVAPLMPPPAREVEPRPQPEAPPPPPPPAPAAPPQPDEEEEEDEEDDEDVQGAAPAQPPSRAVAGALRMLPTRQPEPDEEAE